MATELQLLADACRETEPSERPSLDIVGAALRLIKKELALSSVPEEVLAVRDSAQQVMRSLSATSTSYRQHSAGDAQTHCSSDTSFHREVASAPATLCTISATSATSVSHDQEEQDLDW